MFKEKKLRAQIQGDLSKEGIPSAIYYPVPLHLQPAFSNLGYKKGDLPVSEYCADRILSLPMHPYLTEETQKMIVDKISRLTS